MNYIKFIDKKFDLAIILANKGYEFPQLYKEKIHSFCNTFSLVDYNYINNYWVEISNEYICNFSKINPRRRDKNALEDYIYKSLYLEDLYIKNQTKLIPEDYYPDLLPELLDFRKKQFYDYNWIQSWSKEVDVLHQKTIKKHNDYDWDGTRKGLLQIFKLIGQPLGFNTTSKVLTKKINTRFTLNVEMDLGARNISFKENFFYLNNLHMFAHIADELDNKNTLYISECTNILPRFGLLTVNSIKSNVIAAIYGALTAYDSILEAVSDCE